MAFKAAVICDSIGLSKHRLASIVVTMPRIVLSELRTHRMVTQDDEYECIYRGTDAAGSMLSLNSASSRAIPVDRMIQKVLDEPFIPDLWPKNQRGMQPAEYYELGSPEAELATHKWLVARDVCVSTVRGLTGQNTYENYMLDIHKEMANRLLEPWLWHTVLITATEWSNFFAQRLDGGAQRQMRLTAEAIQAAINASEPKFLTPGKWHLPFIPEADLKAARDAVDFMYLRKLSVARCARVSYEQYDGTFSRESDMRLYERLITGMHMSPFEHQAQAMDEANYDYWSGNLLGWLQHRKMIKGENR